MPGSRATSWIVTLQPRSTRPAVCRACQQYFEEGDTRVCTRSDRKHGRFLHVDCIPGGMRADMEFNADTTSDQIAARLISDQVRHVSSIQAAGEALPVVPSTESALVPPTLESPLPSMAWFHTLQWSDLRKIQGDTYVQIPNRLETAFSDALGVALREIAEESDAQRVIGGWKAFLLLSWLLLYRPPDVQDSPSCAETLSERLDRFWQGDSEAMYREHINASSRNIKSRPPAATTDKMVAKKVKTLCRANEVGRALRAADGAQRVVVTEQVAKSVADLFGPGDNDDMMVDETGHVQPVDMDALKASLSKNLVRLRRLSAPGPLNMRNEHLMVIAGSSAHAASLAGALASLAAGTAPNEVIQFLRGGQLMPLEKDDDTYRPLTLSNVTRRASLKSLLNLHKEVVSDAVGGLQYAVSRKSGIDLMHKSIKARLATFTDSAVTGIDFRTAFQKLKRNSACEAVTKHAQPLEKSCRAWYGGEATHVITDNTGRQYEVHTGEGVDQGCPLGAFIFAVTERDPADKVLQFARNLDVNSDLYMYLDDLYIVAHPSVMTQILDYAAIEFREIGLEINPSKTHAWCANPDSLPPSLRACYQDDFKVLKRALRAPGDTEHQGVRVVVAQSNLDREIGRLQKLTQRLVALVKAGLDLHTALSMLREYAGPASQYTLRTCMVSPQAAADYDVALAKAWSDLLDRQVTSEMPRLWLPLRMGGCGATSARVRMYAAPWASWNAVRDELSQHLMARDIEDLMVRAPLVAQEINHLHAGLLQQGVFLRLDSRAQRAQ